jgi:hypothetical protein
MTDIVLAVTVPGTVLLALCVNTAVMVGWMRKGSNKAERLKEGRNKRQLQTQDEALQR